MKMGKTEAETLDLNGWGVGDILEGEECGEASRILITAVGETKFICKWDYGATGEYDRDSSNTTLSCRDWKKVGEETLHNCDALMEAVRIAKKYLGATEYPTHCEHDTMWLCINPSEVSEQDTKRLENLGFFACEDDGSFKSYKFGSA